MRVRFAIVPLAVVLLLAAPAVRALDHGQDPHAQHEHAVPEQLGNVQFPISCQEEVRATFTRGMALMHSFGYGLAGKAFDEVAAADPACAMAYWGKAMSLFHQIWAPPTPEEFAAGAEAARKAAALGGGTERERAYIAAIGAFYLEDTPRTHLERVKAYEAAMQDVAGRFASEDDEAAIFQALSILAVAYNSPPDKTYERQRRAAEILNAVLPRHRDHPGVAHYMIHSFDYPELAPLALEAARAYAKIAPAAPHALHMPSHIFTRLALWPESIASNLDSAAAARAEMARTQPGATAFDDLHALDYLAYAYLQRAEDDLAREVAETAARTTTVNSPELAAAYALAAVPARYALERRDWRSAAALTPAPASFPWAKFPQAEAIVHFARAVGAARAGELEGARAAYARLAEIQAALAAAYQKGFDWPTQVEILRLAAEGWLRAAAGKGEDAERLLRAAADLEDRTDKHPVTPGAVLPAREQLADLLLERGQAKAALAEYEQSLRQAPGRYASLAGALAAAQAAEDQAAARHWAGALVELTSGAAQRPDLARARLLLTSN